MNTSIIIIASVNQYCLILIIVDGGAKEISR